MKFFLLSLLLLSFGTISAQQENWDVYMAQYQKKPSSITLDMGLKTVAPIKTLPYSVITGVSFRNCDSIGMPVKREFPNLYKVSDSVKALIDRATTNKMAGTFTYVCQRFDYYYVSDTANLRKQLTELYAAYFPLYKFYINIKEDKNWTSYLEFLYPNEATYEYMQNQKLVKALQNGGDKLTRPRQVDHFFYFKNEIDRDCFIKYATQKRFKIVSKEKTTIGNIPFKLRLSRADKVDLAAITRITIEMKKQAKKCNGEYDGWETFVVK